MYQNFPNGYILLLPKQEYRSYSVDSSQKLIQYVAPKKVFKKYKQNTKHFIISFKGAKK